MNIPHMTWGIQHQRSKMLRKNIVWSIILKIIGLATSLIIVPITLGYLDNETYGIWLTISSILYWFSFFDIGLGNGMRNYVAKSISEGDYATGQRFISTTIIILTGIAIAIGVFSLIPLSFLNFNSVFNTTVLSGSYLHDVFAIAIVFSTVCFVARTIGIIYIAIQKYAINDLIGVISHVLALIIIYALTKTTSGSLMYVVIALTATPVAVYMLAAIPLFIDYPQLRPTWKSYDKSVVKKIISKGIGFFSIQITSCLIIFGGSNIVITQFCGPEAVTTYNIAFKYFNLLTIGYTIILAPMWSAYTDAYTKGDIKWISQTFRRALYIWVLPFIAGVLMLIISPFFYRIWIGESVLIPLSVSASVLLYVAFFNLNNCVTYLLNGLNIIRVQIITSCVLTAIYLAGVLVLGNKMGIEGIVLCIAACYFVMSVIHLYQCRLLIKMRATGIWKL